MFKLITLFALIALMAGMAAAVDSSSSSTTPVDDNTDGSTSSGCGFWFSCECDDDAMELVYQCASAADYNYFYSTDYDWAPSWTAYGDYRSFFFRSGDFEDYLSLTANSYATCEYAWYYSDVFDCFPSVCEGTDAYDYFEAVVDRFEFNECYESDGPNDSWEDVRSAASTQTLSVVAVATAMVVANMLA